MDNYCKKTIELYQNFIAFPEMSEKYLKRPPFKYIFQIYLSLQNKTGFAEGVFTREESNADYYTTPERKAAFVKKLSKFVYKGAEKHPSLAKNIIKGEECDKTNDFLCDMFNAATAAKTQAPKKAAEAPAKEKPPAADPVSPRRPSPPPKEVPRPPPAPPTVAQPQPRPPSPPPALKTSEQSREVQQTRAGESRNIKMGTIGDPLHPAGGEEKVELSIEEMRAVVQKVTQNTNPLAKLIDYAEDDLEHMNREYKNWAFVFHEAAAKLDRLESEQDGELDNFNNKIQQLDEQILEFEEKIGGLRGKIFRADQKITQALQKFFS